MHEAGQRYMVIADTQCIAEGIRDRDTAKLMAAAPDLLAACERVLASIKWGYTEQRLTEDEQAAILQAAIDKAS